MKAKKPAGRGPGEISETSNRMAFMAGVSLFR